MCETCGQRFGVASNLNRHVRRCILWPVNATSQTGDETRTPPTTSSTGSPYQRPPSDPSTTTTVPPTTQVPPTDHVGTSPSKTKRTRIQPSSQNSSASSASSGPQSQSQSRGRAPPEPKRPTAKRRRCAPSPTRWIPFSLLAFDLTPAEYHKSTPVPLPPVTPSMNGRWIEERNSWDENVGIAPYHTDWTGKLPGPGFRIGHGLGLGGRDVANLGAGGYFMGRLSLV